MAEFDTFAQLFLAQMLNDDFWVDRGRFQADSEYSERVTTQRLLDMHEEVTELKDSLGLSKHKLQQVTDPYNTKMQIVDILKYTLGLASLLGYDPKTIFEAFIEKSNRLQKDWEAQRTYMAEEMRVVCIDIDGCVADYDFGYTNFLEQEKGLKAVTTEERLEYTFNKRYGISITREEELYDEFVRGGGFRQLKVFPHAARVIHWLIESSFIPVFVTARPNWLYKRISEDTQYWKEQNGFGEVLTIFDKDKADVVINKIAPAKVVAFIEDRDKHAIEIAHIDVKVFLINRSYNINFSEAEFKTIERVGGWGDIGVFLTKEE